MANEGKVTIGVDIDTKQMEKGLENVNQSLDGMSKSAKESAKVFESLFKSPSDVLTQFEKDIVALNPKIQNMGQTASDTGDKLEKAFEDVDTKELNKGLDDVKENLNSSGKQANIFGDMLKANLASEAILGGVKILSSSILSLFDFAVGGLKSLAQQGVEYNAEIQNYTMNFTTLLGSQEAALQRVEELRAMAAKYPMDLADYAKATQTLVGFGVEADRTNEIIKQIGDVSLGNAQKFQGLNLAFAQTMATGRLLGQDLNQMINQGFNPLLEISRTTGESMASLKERMSDGALSAEEVATAFASATAEGGRFYQGMENATGTLEGSISFLQDNFNALIGEVFIPMNEMFMGELIPLANEFVSSLSAAFDEGGVEGLAAGLGAVVAESITYVSEKIPDFLELGGEFITAMIQGFEDNKEKLYEAVGQIGIELLSAIMPDDTATELIENIGELISKIVERVATMGEKLEGIFTPAIQAAIEGISAAIGFLADNFDMIEAALIAVTLAMVAYQATLGISALITTISAAINGMSIATAAATVAQWALNVAMEANPVGIVIAAIVALVAIIMNLWDTNEKFRVALLTAWGHILNFFMDVPLFFQRIGNGIMDAFDTAKIGVLTVMQNMLNGIIDIVNLGIKALNAISNAAIAPIEHATFATNAAVEAAEKSAARVDNLTNKTLENAEAASKRLEDLKKAAVAAGNEAGASFTDEFGQNADIDVGTVINPSDFGDSGKEAGEKATDGLAKGIESGGGKASGAAKKVTNAVLEEQLKMIDQQKSIGEMSLQEEIEALEGILDAVELNADERIEVQKRLYQANEKLRKENEKDEKETAAEIKEIHKDLMKDLADEYKEDLKNFQENQKEQLKELDATVKEKKALYAEERDARLEAAGIEADIVDEGLQGQIDAIKEGQAARRRAETIEREEAAIARATSDEEREKLIRQRDERILQEQEAAQIKSLQAEQKANKAQLKETEKAIKAEIAEKIKQLEKETQIQKDAFEAEMKAKKAEIEAKLKEDNLAYEASQLLLTGNEEKKQAILKTSGQEQATITRNTNQTIQGILIDEGVKQSEIARANGLSIINSITAGLDEGLPAFQERIQQILAALAKVGVSSSSYSMMSFDSMGSDFSKSPMATSGNQYVYIEQTNHVVAQETASETYRELGNIANELVLAF